MKTLFETLDLFNPLSIAEAKLKQLYKEYTGNEVVSLDVLEAWLQDDLGLKILDKEENQSFKQYIFKITR